MARKTSFLNVARLAQVSPATVSRVASGIARVNPEVAERVRNAAESLGIDLHRGRKANIVGFLLGNRQMLHAFHSRILAGAEAYCSARGYSVLFLPYQYSFNVPWRLLRVPQIWRRRDVICGVIVAGANAQNVLDLLSHHRIPFTAFGNNVTGDWRHEEYDAVWFDDILGSYEMTQHLQFLGHRDIWFVANCQLPWFARRYQGYRRAMEEAGLTPRLSEVHSDKAGELGYLAAKSLLSRGESVSAIFAGDDYVAGGVYKALSACGLRIPEEVSVVGFSDVEAEILNPPLTTARVFPEQVGKHLAQQLLDRVAKPSSSVQHCTIPTQLVIRASCRRLFKVPEPHEGRSQAPKTEAADMSGRSAPA
jgi:DNA-binding LacI/PurR family transcriptional regulator